jgi:uncharacterized membrane protein
MKAHEAHQLPSKPGSEGVLASADGLGGGQTMTAIARTSSLFPSAGEWAYSNDATAGDASLTATFGRLFTVAAICLLLIATGLRVYHLGRRSLWFDEALTANVSRGSLSQALEETRVRGSAPIVHPYILYLVERFGTSADDVRMPSLLASLMAVGMMLAMVRCKVTPAAALFAAAILATSASQVRYAQEVREYSLAVLYAAVLIYSLLRWEATGSRDRHPSWLYTALFFAPLVQYGLVLLSAAILGTMLVRVLFTKETPFRVAHIASSSFFLACGGLLSYFLTLRYQFQPGKGQWYLAANYFDPKTMKPLHFLFATSGQMFSFFMPGQIISVCFIGAAVFFCWVQCRTRRVETVTLIVALSFAVTIFAALLKAYPYGGIRQDLFLSPGLILFAGMAFASVLRGIKKHYQPVAVVTLLLVILFSGYRGLMRQYPYKEYEDTLSILHRLSGSMAPTDEVWVNHDAVEAIDFYTQEKDRRFVYGNYHKNPQEYLPELLASIKPNNDRLWLVFSHLEQPSDLSEEKLIVGSLPADWDVRSVLTPTNAGLYFAERKHPKP